MATYSYRPELLEKDPLYQMRLELGDTTLAPGELTAALSDEEYRCILKTTKNWKKAKLKCLEAILMRFAHQVDFSMDGVSYSFSQRVEFWKQLRDELKKTASMGVPTANPLALNGRLGGEPYFYNDMQANLRKGMPSHGDRR